MIEVRKCTNTHTHTVSLWSLYPALCVPTSSYRLISNNNSRAGWVFGQQLSLQRGTAHLSNGGSFAGVTACLNMRPLALQARSFSPLSGSPRALALSLPLPLAVLSPSSRLQGKLLLRKSAYPPQSCELCIVHETSKGIASLMKIGPHAGRVPGKASHGVLLTRSKLWNGLCVYVLSSVNPIWYFRHRWQIRFWLKAVLTLCILPFWMSKHYYCSRVCAKCEKQSPDITPLPILDSR